MSENSMIKDALLGGADSVFDSLLQAEIEQGKSRNDGLANVLIQAVDARYGPHGRAMKHMRHFLSGKGTEVTFALTDLLTEDKGAAARVSGEVLRRANDIMTVSEVRNTQKPMTPKHKIDPVITLFQKTFAVEDWAGALGTFPITWELIACPAKKTSPLTVLLRGENEYRWHPNDERLTRKLHQFAQELIEAGKAKPFTMKANLQTMLVGQLTGDLQRASFVKQTNPNHNSIAEFATLKQMSLVGKAAAHGYKRSHPVYQAYRLIAK